MKKILYAGVFTFYASTALAESKNEIVNSCLQAIDDNNLATIEVEAEKILEWKNLFSDELKSKGAKCLEAATRKSAIYDETAYRFVIGEATKSAISPQMARRIEKDFFNAKEQYENALKEADEINKAIIKSEVFSACNSSYLNSPEKTMLNEICIDSFTENGHPNLGATLNDDKKFLRAREYYNETLQRYLKLK